jgi:hypothetical protein
MQVDIFGTNVTYGFNEYNKKTKKKIEVSMTLTDAHKREISNQMDSTDMGEFFHFEDDKKVVNGFFYF